MFLVRQNLKRKELTDGGLQPWVDDAFGNLEVSPHKKFRVDDDLYPIVEDEELFVPAVEPSAGILASDGTLASLEPPIDILVPPVPVTDTSANDKAIVLYRRVNGPLFPGGPPAGSADLPIKLKALSPYPGLDISGNKHALSSALNKLLRGTVEDASISASSLEDISMEQSEPSNSSLAIVPWREPRALWQSSGAGSSSSRTFFGSAGAGPTELSEAAEEELLMNEDLPAECQMDDQGEDMVVEDGNVSSMPNPPPAQCGSYVNINFPFWQQHNGHGYLEAPYQPISW